mmetsp:Transcript_12972/g.17939  ORF Transcript_12972/g.17939 Transcript_12972/m.17939 type:complete len:83 (-) Transcript_12972:508-756(-)
MNVKIHVIYELHHGKSFAYVERHESNQNEGSAVCSPPTTSFVAATKKEWAFDTAPALWSSIRTSHKKGCNEKYGKQAQNQCG